MDTKIIFKKQENDEITKLFNWIKKSKRLSTYLHLRIRDTVIITVVIAV